MQQQLGEANTTLCTKEAECVKLAEERDRLVTQLAEQTERLQMAQWEAKTKETDLLAESEVERSAWADKEAQMIACFSSIGDLVDGELLFLFFVVLSCRPLSRPTASF